MSHATQPLLRGGAHGNDQDGILERGASINKVTNIGTTPSDIASQRGHDDIVRLISAACVSPLHRVCMSRDPARVLAALRLDGTDPLTGPPTALEIVSNQADYPSLYCDEAAVHLRLAMGEWAPSEARHRVWPASFRRGVVTILPVGGERSSLSSSSLLTQRHLRISAGDRPRTNVTPRWLFSIAGW